MKELRLPPDETKLFEIFMPYAMDRIRSLMVNDTKLVHYTSADAALSIIERREIWMRKSSCMSDFSEVQYGLKCLSSALNSGLGNRLKIVLDELFPGFSAEFDPLFRDWVPHFQHDTYLTCISEHDPAEDECGRLSMWRAFGHGTRVALVLHSSPFLSDSNALNVFSSPVAYLSPREFEHELERLVAGVERDREFVGRQGSDNIKNRLFNAFRFAALCTKHPGFREEREWRLIYSPALHPSTELKQDVKSVGGVPQTIYKIPLQNIPESGLHGVEVSQLLKHVIIGPTQFAPAVFDVLARALVAAGMSDAAKRIRISDIPLRESL